MLQRGLPVFLLIPLLTILSFCGATLRTGSSSEADLSSPVPKILALTHLTVIDVTGGSSKPDMTVIVSGPRIVEVGRTRDVRLPEGARVIDGTGKYLIPGLWDMHWHSPTDGEMRAFYFPLAIANGITGVRDLHGDCFKGCDGLPDIQDRNKWRKQMAAGTLLAPRIVASSQIVDGAKPTWPQFLSAGNTAQARRTVRTIKKRGVDLIKVYSLLSRESYFALADEARQQNISFAGHIPISISPVEASDAGQKSLEHLDFILAFSTREPEIMQELAQEIESLKKREEFFTELVYYVLDHNLIKMTDSYDSRKVAEVAKRFNRNDTWVCPTLVLHRSFAFPDEPEYANDIRLKYVSSETRQDWADSKLWRLSAPFEIQAGLKKGFPTQLQIVGAARRAGINFLAGTDVTNLNIYPGSSLHEELELFVKAGFTPLEALQTATINPARYLGQADALGSIEKGKFADLVLLEANPLEDIRNTQRIAAIVLNGRLVSKDELQLMLAKVEVQAGKP